jgi:hypothetical protein
MFMIVGVNNQSEKKIITKKMGQCFGNENPSSILFCIAD